MLDARLGSSIEMWRVAGAVIAGYLTLTGVWPFGAVVRLSGLTPNEKPPPASSPPSQAMAPSCSAELAGEIGTIARLQSEASLALYEEIISRRSNRSDRSRHARPRR